MKSKITNGDTTYLFSAKVLGKYDVKYYGCNDTGFIQTEDPHWLPEAYSSAITSLDLGILYRNIKLSKIVIQIISRFFNPDGLFLDYAGGYGIFTRLMRDNGYNFYHHDQFCENLFAKHFELNDLKINPKFELTTAFELFEHLSNPLEEIEAILSYSDTILFSTELVPDQKITKPEDWWYIAPETGQHISFYTKKSLEIIATKLNLNFYTNELDLHMLTQRSDIKTNPLIEDKPAKKSFLSKMLGSKAKSENKVRPSLLEQDFNYVRSLISQKQ